MENETNIDKNLESLLEEVAKEQNFRDYKIENAKGSIKGDGYIGIITCVKIIGKNEKSEPKVLDLVIKSAPKSDALRTEMPVSIVFNREIYIYNSVLPTFQIFEMEKGLETTYFAPKLYKTNTSNKSEAIVLENLKESGFKLYERRIAMNDDHVSLVMAQYGRFHALSFALRDQNPEKFEKIIGCMDDIIFKFLRGTFFSSIMHRCTKALESLDADTDKEAFKHFQRLIDGLGPFLEDLITSSDNYYSVALHADCWTNNMMFKYENNTTKPIDVRFIDFQISKLGLPVFDLCYFFYACSSKEAINNLDYYLQVYYKSFSTYLRNLGSDPDKLFPYSVLQEQWKKYAKFGLVMSTMIIHAMLSEKDEIIDLKDIAESEKQEIVNAFTYDIASVDEYNDRIRHVILHFEENNFF